MPLILILLILILILLYPSYTSVYLILNTHLFPVYSYIFLLHVQETGVTFAQTPRGLTVGKPQQSQKTSLPRLLSTLSLTPLYSFFNHTSLPTHCMRNRSHLRTYLARANSWETPAVSIYLPSYTSLLSSISLTPLYSLFYSYFSSYYLYKKKESTSLPRRDG